MEERVPPCQCVGASPYPYPYPCQCGRCTLSMQALPGHACQAPHSDTILILTLTLTLNLNFTPHRRRV